MAGEAASSSMRVRADGGDAQDGATVALGGGRGWRDEEDLAVAFLEVRLPASTPEPLPATPRKLMFAATSPSSCRRQPLQYAAPGHLPNQLLPEHRPTWCVIPHGVVQKQRQDGDPGKMMRFIFSQVSTTDRGCHSREIGQIKMGMREVRESCVTWIVAALHGLRSWLRYPWSGRCRRR
ncbi:hypothetical protein ACQ4PT_011407 [Festuca glaucescens]